MSTAAFLGSQFRINATLAGDQALPSITAISGNRFAVAWRTPNPGNGDPDLRARIFNADGAAATAEFDVAVSPSINDQRVSVAPLGAGFAAVWHSAQPQTIPKIDFNAGGAVVGGPGVLANVANVGIAPRIATSTAGTSMTVWSDIAQAGADAGTFSIFARGTGGIVTVNTNLAGNQQHVSVAPILDGTGNFIVAWVDDPGNAAKTARAQIVNAAGAKVGGEFIAGNAVAGEPTQVIGRVGGGFAISYVELFNIRVETYAANGARVGGFQANPVGEGSYLHGLAALSNGLYAVAFEDFAFAARTTVRVFAPDGTQVGASFTLPHASGPGAFTGNPAISALANGQFVVVFGDADGAADTDIAAQRFSSSTIAFIEGTAGANIFNGATQTGFFLGYDGADTVTYAAATAGATVNLASQAFNAGAAAGDEIGVSVETVTGTNFNDQLVGDARANILNGGGASDLIFGGAGADALNGDAGGDFIDGGAAGDAMNGGADFDTVSWLNSTERAVVVLTNQTQNNFAALGDNVANFESYYLTSFDDVFANNGNGGYIYGFAGADVIAGGAGSEIVDGGAGGDTLNGGAGFDYLSWVGSASGLTVNLNNQASNAGAAAGDVVTNFEVYSLTDHADSFTGINNGASIVYGFAGADTLTGGADATDWLIGGDGADTMIGGTLNDLLSGEAGNDIYRYNTWVGEGFDSILTFTTGADKFRMTGSNFGFAAGATLTAGVNFISGAAPVASGARPTFLYYTGAGFLYFDLDGSGSAFSAVALAQIAGAPTLVAGDFQFV